MFERMTRDARAVLVDAVARAREDEAPAIDEEHLLAGLLARPTIRAMLPEDGSAPAGDPDRSAATAALLRDYRAASRRAGLSSADAAALARLGIDVDDLVRRVESVLGPGAMDAAPSRAGRRRRRLTLAPAAHAVLERSLSTARDRGERELRAEHLLLGLLSRSGVATDVLATTGITERSVRAALDTAGRPHGRAS